MATFTALDWAVMLIYLVGITAFGIFKGGKQRSSTDYFLSDEKIPWLVVSFSIVATETSALTFISIPGLAYLTNLNFLQIAIGYIIGRLIVSQIFLPQYFKGELTTVYELIETKFGANLRKLTSAVFIVTRLFADGVRLYATAIPLTLILKGYGLFQGISDLEIYLVAISLISLLTMLYVLYGGLRAVIWTDLVQLLIYTLGGVLSLVFILTSLSSPTDAVQHLRDLEKLTMFNLDFSDIFSNPYNMILAIFGGMFLSMASHGTDYIIVQRLFATQSLDDSKKALVFSGIMVFVQFLIFLVIGSLLYVVFNGVEMKADEVFPMFIIESLPQGISGLIVAGILAAAMSTLSSSINSISSATIFDILKPFSKPQSKPSVNILTLSRKVSLFWGLVLIGFALFFTQSQQSVVETALSIASVTYGGVLGVFLLGTFRANYKPLSVAIGFISSLAAMAVIVFFFSIAWTLYTFIGASVALLVAFLLESVPTKVKN